MRYQIPIVSTIVALFGLLGYLIHDLYFAEQTKPSQASFAMTVRLAPVGQEIITESYEAVGTARAQLAVFISTQNTALIEKIHFYDNAIVKKGDLLISLDNKVELAQMEKAEILLRENQRLLDHYKTLRQKNAVSETKVEEQKALVSAGQAQVNEARARMDVLEIRAPFDGRLGTWLASPGALIGKSQTINSLDDTRKVKVDFTIPETYISLITPEMEFVANTPAYPDKMFVGVFDHLQTRVDAVTRAATVRVNIANPENLLKPGMLLSINLVKSKANALVVPEEALVPTNDKQFVYRVSADNKAVKQEVTIGRRRPGLVEIVDGLAMGDEIVVEGAFKLKPGFPVKVLPNDKKVAEKIVLKPALGANERTIVGTIDTHTAAIK